MKYIKAQGIEEQEYYYFEVDAEMIAYRQITVMNGRYMISIAPDFFLAEKEIELFEGDEEISHEQFNEIWNKAIAPYRTDWEQVKQDYVRGTVVNGSMMMFYPQGVIIQLSETAYAIADTSMLSAQTKPELMYPGYQVQGTVTGYDNNNFWLILEHCTGLMRE
ncbi:hypothetical protein RE628_15240 [Paenibacillus sp. D2_2]|uniref:hypothetical protein n=1 Tax=Paenibacillus sp. D2_2 TaxID=3073092 RepID=UPI0028162E5A|nr:hypothetical protein [Paenibacillus sp. D2_2]WMT38895.1 hypothetical protein RE628_15240 [Paenibacillus sp. D2_2]